MYERGIIRNEKQAQVLRDFSGLRFERGITPTDIDGFVEFADDVYVLIESKYTGSSLGGGQRKALERLTDCISHMRNSILIVCNHGVNPETGQKIDVGACIVQEYRTTKKWHKPTTEITVRRLIDLYRKHVEAQKKPITNG
jgi:hypothetical protein